MKLTPAVALTFFFNGLALASWAGRIPDVRDALGLSDPGLGLLLLALSGGSVTALLASGSLIHRWGPRLVLQAGTVLVWAGVSGVALSVSALGSVAACAASLLCYGVGTGIWDVAMNVEAAEVERVTGRPIMSRFHAAFSLGTVTGAGGAALAAHLSSSLLPHLLVVAVLAASVSMYAARGFTVEPQEEESSGVGAAWRERRTLLIGLLVLVLALTEGTATDWLAVALEDGYGASRPVAVLGFAAFVSAMTLGRLVGPALLQRVGRVPAVAGTMLLSLVGVLLTVFGAVTPLVVLGIVLWGVGASLGFPVGMSAAADDPRRAAARVSVVSTIGYTAFLSGPPLLGFLAGQVGTLHALLVLAVLVVLTLPLTRVLAPRT